MFPAGVAQATTSDRVQRSRCDRLAVRVQRHLVAPAVPGRDGDIRRLRRRELLAGDQPGQLVIHAEGHRPGLGIPVVQMRVTLHRRPVPSESTVTLVVISPGSS